MARRPVAIFCPLVPMEASLTPLYMSNTSPKRRRRVRKDSQEGQPPAVEPQKPPAPELKPREETSVEFKIQDVRDVVAGRGSGNMVEKTASAVERGEEEDDEWEYVDIYEEEDDDEYEYVLEDSSGRKLDSLEQLLADARAMREEERKDQEDKDAESLSVPDKVRSVISTIVTIDFFVVIALLLWFLAGIFGSYVLQNDSIQIAFNNIFNPVVQPALGILMIGSAAGAIFQKEEGDQNMD